jgi:hypothetical protein
MGADLPCHKTDSFYNSRLNDLFPREHTPCNSIRSFRMGVSAQVPIFVQDVVCDIAIAFDVFEEQSQELGLHKELQIGL